jgi:hypothetical protein
MRRIAIIGSGQAGLLAAHALLKSGYEVTLYSDRTAEQWLTESRPTGTATRFDMSLQFEYELGLNSWENDAPWTDGAHMTMCPAPGNRMLTLAGRMRRPCLSIDLRLQSHAWTLELMKRGGQVIVEKVTPARLDEISSKNDLTLVATGRSDLSKIFERDPVRSVYDKPLRNLAMMCVKGPPAQGFDGIPLLPVKNTLIGGVGEIIWVPYYHKDVGASWNIIVEAIPGGPMDVFQGFTSGEQVLEAATKMIRTYTPWDAERMRNAELSDPLGWLVGKFAPTVRKPVGKLPSGRLVMPLGDAAMSMDPIGGQGANNGNKMVRNLVDSVVARGELPFDAEWMTDTFERFYARHGEATFAFSHSLLGPPPPAVRDLFFAQYGSDGRPDNVSGPQLLANAFVDTLNDPAILMGLAKDRRKMHEFIEKVTGRSWIRSVASGAMGVAWEEFRQWRGMEPRHPTVREHKVAA